MRVQFESEGDASLHAVTSISNTHKHLLLAPGITHFASSKNQLDLSLSADMSFAARNSLRSVARQAPRFRSQAVRARTFAGAAPTEGAALQKYLEAEKALGHHAAGECPFAAVESDVF